MAVLDIFRISDEKELTADELAKYIRKNDSKTTAIYAPLWRAYTNDYDIFHAPKKAAYKPDNRLAVNFAQFIVDTFEGFFMGNPVKISSDDEAVEEYINAVDDANDGDDLNAELSTIVSIFGRGYRIVYVDEAGEIGSAYLDPMESFAIYSEAITPRMRYFVRIYTDSDNKKHGSVSDNQTVRYFDIEGGSVKFTEEYQHGFNGVPAVEFVQNRARRGIFQSVMPLINAYNKALSEKADDVEYFSDAYLKVQGAKIDRETIKFMRENRIINLAGTNGANVLIDFLAKPNADGTQEALLQRMERLIFTIAMVCNISDDNFATSSGIALKYKMLPMINLAAKKWRKFERGLNDTYKLICSNPVTPMKDDDWQSLAYTHILNYPANVAEEAAIAASLSGVTSKKTQLSVLSIVDDVQTELDQIEEEQKEALEYMTEYETARAAAGGDDEEEINSEVSEPTVQTT